MINNDIFVGYVAFPLGEVSLKEIKKAQKEYEDKYKDIYSTEVISDYYNEVGVVFSIEETDEIKALDFFEEQQSELFGTIDFEEFKRKKYNITSQQKVISDSLDSSLDLIEKALKDIGEFNSIFDAKNFTGKELKDTHYDRTELSNFLYKLQNLRHGIQIFKS